MLSNYRNAVSFISAAVAGTLIATSVFAADLIRIGKSSNTAFAFTVVEMGERIGAWEKQGLEVEVLEFAGDSKLQQGLVSNAIELGLGSGPGMGFFAKGVPAKTVAPLVDAPANFAIIAGANSSISTPEDVKGKRIGITSPGSLTYWLAVEFARRQGWGIKGVETVPLGTTAALISALTAGQIDAFILTTATGYRMEAEGVGRIVTTFGESIPQFHTHMLFATDVAIAERPEQIRKFIAGWKETVDYMAEHKQEAAENANAVAGIPLEIALREYDNIMPIFNRELKYSDAALDLLAQSFVDLEIVPEKPNMQDLYTTEFLPK